MNTTTRIQEDAGSLQLGEEYNGQICLTNAELLTIFEHLGGQNNNVYEMTKDHLEKFAQPNLPSNDQRRGGIAQQVRQLLQDFESQSVDNQGNVVSRKLQQFEIAKLANFVPGDYEEAVTLFPSLQSDIPQEDLENLLNDLRKLVEVQ